MSLSKEIVEKILLEIIKRENMPQIKGDDIPEALNTFDKYGVPYKKTIVKTDELNPIQSNYNPNKVDSIAKELRADNPLNSIFISNDNFIVDGHHRWLAYKKKDMPFMNCIQIGYPKKAALALFDKVSDKIEETVPLVFPDGTINGSPRKKDDLNTSKYRKKEKQLGGKSVSEEKLDEKYLTVGKHFTAIRDLNDYDIKMGDEVKITGNELADGYFGLKNLRNNEEIRMYSLVFIRNFK